MSGQPRAWVLNLEAEHELEVGGAFTPSRHLRALVARQQRRLLGNLVAPGDIVLGQDDVGDDARRAEGLPGVAWCPTPGAVARLASAGAAPVAAPPLATLRAVNARPFAVDVRAPLADASFGKHVAANLEEVLALVARPATGGWLVRRSFGAAGRGRRRLRAGRPDPGELAWLRASLRRGPLVVEPWVRVTREYTRSGWVASDGQVTIAQPCFQETTVEGAWVRTERPGRGEVRGADDAELEVAAHAAGTALARSGYFGPFGIDAFRHRVSGRTEDVLNPLSEINARYTMDWTTGMTARPDRRD